MSTPPLRIEQKDGSYIEFGHSYGTGEIQVNVDDTVESVAVQLNREQALRVIQHLSEVFDLEADQ